MHLKYRKTCRSCGSPALKRVVDLGVQYLQGVFPPKAKGPSPYPVRRVPMTLVRCDPSVNENGCGLLQTEHGVPPELMYRVYWYRSGTNATMRSHLQSIVDSLVEMQNGKTKSVLDIGCNDGTLLGFFPKQVARVGIDPSNIVPATADGVTYIRDFFPSAELRATQPNAQFDVITSIAMFYDLEDPTAFVNEVRSLLSPSGLWAVEVSYMPTMLQQGSYDSICHEHLSYFSLSVLENIFERCSLKIVRAEFNDMNGGSIRCFVTHKSCLDYKSDQSLSHLQEIRVREFDMLLDDDTPYRKFQTRVERNREELSELINSLAAQGKRIHLYGASTKGNTMLQWCELDSRTIECAADRNPEKWGLCTPGSGIPIVSEEESRIKVPDYYLVMPWHFKKEFLEREQKMLERGCGFIFPLPELDIVKRG